MTRFNNQGARARGTSPVQSTRPGRNAAGGPGWSRTTKSELFLLAVANFVGQDTFYEDAKGRDSRYVKLVRDVTLDDPQWTYEFLRWLRSEAQMRTAAIVGAVEFVKARLDAGDLAGQAGDGLNRKVVNAVLQRADEPGELLAYWTSKYGRSLPKPVKRGVADAVQRLYNEYSLLKYDTDSKGYRFGDVLELVHAKPNTDKWTWQGDLFEYAIDRRQKRDKEIPLSLTKVSTRQHLYSLPVEERRAALTESNMKAAGMTWEALSGWLQGPLDAEAWESVIPQMGYMALLRNLRNFDEAGISRATQRKVMDRLEDPEQVARSRQFPFRFLSAYQAVESTRWGGTLEEALQHSLANVPELSGNTLILVDRSGSMFSYDHYSYGRRSGSELDNADKAAVFGSALALRAEKADLVEFGSTYKTVPFRKGASVLKMVDKFSSLGGTNTRAAVQGSFRNHDRVIIVTDEQGWGYYGSPTASIPDDVPVYTWNLAGYRTGHDESGAGNRHTFGGLTDKAFQMVPLLEAGRNASWPWEA